MKRIILTILIASLALIVLFESGILDALAIFLLAGIIPGTDYAIPSSFMLLLMTSIAWLLVFNAFPFDTVRPAARSKKKAAVHKKRLPKQRFKQV